MALTNKVARWLESIDENENDFRSFYTLEAELRENKEDLIAVLYYLYHIGSPLKPKIENILRISCPVEAQPFFTTIFK